MSKLVDEPLALSIELHEAGSLPSMTVLKTNSTIFILHMIGKYDNGQDSDKKPRYLLHQVLHPLTLAEVCQVFGTRMDDKKSLLVKTRACFDHRFAAVMHDEKWSEDWLEVVLEKAVQKEGRRGHDAFLALNWDASSP